MSRRIISILACIVATTFATASEFWLEPKKFHYAIGEEMKIDFREGDGFTGELWDMKEHRVEWMQWYSLTGTRDLIKTVKPTHGNNIMLKFPVEGTQVLVLRSQGTLRNWSGDQFGAYLEEHELNEILELRKRTTSLGDSIKESYTRLAKVLVQVGDRTDDAYKKKTGLRLEIIPTKNPYALKTGDYLSCQVLFEGKPMAHALVKVWSRLNHTTFLQNIYSEKDGTIVFPISTKGAWMVSTVKMISSEKPGVDWESLWGSLVFGI